MWSPNVQEPLVKMLCHRSAIKSLAINQTGNYMITSGLDHLLNIWDLRTYKQLRSIKLTSGASNLAFSQKNLIAASLRDEIVIFKHNLLETSTPKNKNDETDEILIENLNANDVYLKHRLNSTSIQNLQFCPYEDVLGIGHSNGISSILIPGKRLFF